MGTRRLYLSGVIDMEKEVIDNDADGKLHDDQLMVTKRVAATQRDCPIKIDYVIERIIERYKFERPVLPFAQILGIITLKRIKPNKLNAHMLLFHRRVNTFDEQKLT